MTPPFLGDDDDDDDDVVPFSCPDTKGCAQDKAIGQIAAEIATENGNTQDPHHLPLLD